MVPCQIWYEITIWRLPERYSMYLEGTFILQTARSTTQGLVCRTFPQISGLIALMLILFWLQVGSLPDIFGFGSFSFVFSYHVDLQGHDGLSTGTPGSLVPTIPSVRSRFPSSFLLSLEVEVENHKRLDGPQDSQPGQEFRHQHIVTTTRSYRTPLLTTTLPEPIILD